MDKIAEALAELPSDLITKDQDIVATYTTDYRQLYTGTTKALLRPRNTAEVQQIVRTCVRHGVPIVPQAGNTGYCAGATPSDGGDELVLSLERMNKVRELDTANLSITADAGAILSELQQSASDAGLLFPLSLGSKQSCRIGGNLSTNAGGISVLRYGMMRDLVLGLEVVLPDGSLFQDLSPLRKNNAGYDVKQMFIGAEGTLGVITGASLKLVRKSQQTVTSFLAINDIADLAYLLDRAQVQTGESITSFEYISQKSLALLMTCRPDLRHPLGQRTSHYVLLEAATASPVLNLQDTVINLLEDLFEAGKVSDGAVAASEQQRAEFWQIREGIPEAEVHHGGSVKHDVAVRTSQVAGFINSASQLVQQYAEGAILSIYGHVGDGNVHFNIVPRTDANPVQYKKWLEREISPRIYHLVADMHGSFSAEYGIGRAKIDLLQRYGDPGKLDLMKKVKAAFDPNQSMNPGKVVPGLSRLNDNPDQVPTSGFQSRQC